MVATCFNHKQEGKMAARSEEEAMAAREEAMAAYLYV